MKNKLKIVAISGMFALSLAAVKPSSFDFIRYSDTGNNENGEIIGVRVYKGIREIQREDGSKEYYIAGKYLKEMVKQYNEAQ